MAQVEPPSTKKLIVSLLIVIATASAAGRICSVVRVVDPTLFMDEANPDPRRTAQWPAQRPRPMPTLGSNDTSRWATVRSLVDNGTYVVGYPDPDNPKVGTGILFENGWYTVDKVLKHPEKNEFYSSKPPLLPTLVAGLYWLINLLLGWTLQDNPFSVVRAILLLINLLPFAIYLGLLSRLLNRGGPSDWTRIVVLAAAGFATLVTPFLVSFNNHTIATFCVLFALYPVFAWIRFPTDRSPERPSRPALVVSGLFAGLSACIDLPATSFAVLLGVLLWFQGRRRTLLYFLPAALLPILVQLCLNYAAIGDWNYAYSKKWGDTRWYEYEGSPWERPSEGQKKFGTDFAWTHESRGQYAFNVLLGHHGLFTLTPIWLLALVAMAWSIFALRRRRVEVVQSEPSPGPDWCALACMTALLTLVTLGFYLIMTDNYGGRNSGMRWLMWLIPLWLLTMLPVVDWLAARRWGRCLTLILVGWSVFSASYPTWSPWRHPWLYNLLDSAGYVPY